MNIKHFNVFAVPGTDRVRIRCFDPYHPEHIEVGKNHIAAIADLHWLAFGALPAFFFKLKGIDFPVGNIAEPYLIPYMMLDRHGIDLDEAVEVFETYIPEVAYVLAVQIFLKMPPPPLVIHRLQY